ncbi:F-box protein At5g03970-like isoform X1 [Solanum pennellii]|uniref:F-box protein At5g03970-like isoform X1 n=1 Tax=Solanum pennellii TaxID=28526 RepID=A0ABM1FI92_SOLPN|nr:F-box protein At5g03970-like isoform X1 [Solanum pennellii]XP_015057220.1 F-box protein At5g03970-like isoform X1 [Solanum pennellii]XP_027768563.1 F-box protein At5g03970-like isoform X1 [Solanum pennellii]
MNCQHKLFVSEEIVINILNRLPLKSLARFECVSKNWQKVIAEVYRNRLRWPKPYQIGFFFVERRSQSRFFFSSKESPLLVGAILDKSINFIGERVYIVSSSNGFLLCNKLRSRQRVYYVYNPATRQRLDLPKTQICMKDPYVGFTCKVDEDNSVSFTIVRYETPPSTWHELQYYLIIESFSSEANVWTANKQILDVPLQLYPSRDKISSSSSGVVDGVFFWLDNSGERMTVFDSVEKSFWAFVLPEWRTPNYLNSCCLGFTGGELCFAYNRLNIITCWRLINFRSRDNAVWVWKYVVDVTDIFQKCSEDFGLGGGSNLGMEVQNMVFHPVLPCILYLQIRGKVIVCDVSTRVVELVYDFGEAWRKTHEYKLFSYEWTQWPRLL